MRNKDFILKGHICYSENSETLTIMEDSYLVCVDGISKGVFREIPEAYRNLPMKDYSGHLVMPGLTDLHVHAPQYAFRGLGMDWELLEWLNTQTFPEESKYGDEEYARKAYRIFAEDLKRSGTTRAAVFATIHVPGTEILMEELELAGVTAYVGKVNMDRNSPEYLIEETKASAEATRRWLSDLKEKEAAGNGFRHVKPILTPRFIPSCTDELMRLLAEIQKEYHLPVQSHLSENFGEIAWVKELCPEAEFYGDAYDRFGLFGEEAPAIMAHCVHSGEREIQRMKERGVYVAHCPQSNTNLSSGIAPIRRYLNEGIHVGLGSDVAGGHSLSIFRAITDAIQESKLRWRLCDDSLKPLTVEEAFYLGTMGGGSFFGRAGSFLEGYEVDALVLDESRMRHPQELTVRERLERFLYLCGDQDVLHKFAARESIF
ncbi:MAG: amidohydrolase family protein [Lachnospiraceae bacterium]|nr:amidohydrolase family protein [Lachnospiraceae bacterium]